MSRNEDRTDAVDRDRRHTAIRPLLLVAVAGAVVVAAIVVVAALRPAAPVAVADGFAIDAPPRFDSADPLVGRALPETTLPALADFGPAGGLALPDTGGGPMVINFWASWCAPCVNEMPMLQRVADDLDVTLVGVDYIDQPDKAVDLAARLDIRYPLVRDDEGTYGQAVGLFGTPTTLLVDGDGIVRRRLTGELTEQQLRDAIVDDLG